ncbi:MULTISPECIES: ester cyclase [unclassified Arthrobacter]|uniref:ester cyclase n=1 Tax=unclassified Arthrobacter TaxID=235627 RepID=UPI00159E60BD|nr:MULTISPECIES: ester cyclase [unclassified Arthrobacter]MCQ9164527.1 ester cyclase [Arthrobacter sp. STN4]NVM98230.1 ester cyclase [Arthrobacter sp. SDTb3-6]
MSKESELKAHVRRVWHSVWDEGDVDALDALLADGFTRVTEGSSSPLDAAAYKGAVRTTRAAFPDLKTTVEDLVEEDGHLAIFWSSTGTHSNELFGVPATGRTVQTFGVNFCTFTDGRLFHERVTWDPRQLLNALGITSLGED